MTGKTHDYAKDHKSDDPGKASKTTAPAAPSLQHTEEELIAAVTDPTQEKIHEVMEKLGPDVELRLMPEFKPRRVGNLSGSDDVSRGDHEVQLLQFRTRTNPGVEPPTYDDWADVLDEPPPPPPIVEDAATTTVEE